MTTHLCCRQLLSGVDKTILSTVLALQSADVLLIPVLASVAGSLANTRIEEMFRTVGQRKPRICA